jgi:hypothetical protein
VSHLFIWFSKDVFRSHSLLIRLVHHFLTLLHHYQLDTVLKVPIHFLFSQIFYVNVKFTCELVFQLSNNNLHPFVAKSYVIFPKIQLVVTCFRNFLHFRNKALWPYRIIRYWLLIPLLLETDSINFHVANRKTNESHILQIHK